MSYKIQSQKHRTAIRFYLGELLRYKRITITFNFLASLNTVVNRTPQIWIDVLFFVVLNIPFPVLKAGYK